MRKASLWAAVLSSVIAHHSALADDMNERIQIGISLIKLACGTGTSGQTLAVEKKSDSGVTLKAVPSNGSEKKNEPKPAQKSVSYSKNEFQGLVVALNKEFSEAAAKFSRDQMECMRPPYVQRIFDTVIPPQKPPPTPHQTQQVAQRPPQQPTPRPFQGCQSAPSIRSVYKRSVILFNYGQTTLGSESVEDFVGPIADAIFNHPGTKIGLIGYADTSGEPQEGQATSELRAEAVREILIQFGVARDRITAVGRGSCDFRIPTAAGVREPQNRAVEIILGY